MATLSANRFEALTGRARQETDPLGNTKPVKNEAGPRSKRDAARKLHTRVAVSPPSRRGRDRASPTTTDSAAPGGLATTGGTPDHASGANQRPARGRQFDRHSGTGIQDNMKKINQGWGRAGAAERDAENDTLSPEDPAAEGKPTGTASGTATPTDSNYRTLDEYLATQPALNDRYKLPEARQANEGVDESQWKGAVLLARAKEDDVYFGGMESLGKHKSRSRKDKVHLDTDQPSHHQQVRNNGRRGNGVRSGRGKPVDIDISISDPSAFPTVGHDD